jgi:hypothetical protein
MNLEKAVCNINRSINKRNPETFNSQWIKYRCRISYQYIVDNIVTEFSEPDWDLVVYKLERCNQKIWMKGVKRAINEPYKDLFELDIILKKYQDKLYTFLAQQGKEDRCICDIISIKLVRLSQRGNILAEDKAIILFSYLINQWLEYDKSLSNWKGYDELIVKLIKSCIRRFRYTGSFLGYLYRTMEYSGRGLVPLEKFSLDDFSIVTGRRLLETFIKDDII